MIAPDLPSSIKDRACLNTSTYIVNRSASSPSDRTNAAGIHSGANTHSQLHVIKPVSFNTKNIKNSTVPQPMPLLAVAFV